MNSAGNHITGHFSETPLQNSNDDGTMKIERDGRRDISRTLGHGLEGNFFYVTQMLSGHGCFRKYMPPLSASTKKGK